MQDVKKIKKKIMVFNIEMFNINMLIKTSNEMFHLFTCAAAGS